MPVIIKSTAALIQLLKEQDTDHYHRLAIFHDQIKDIKTYTTFSHPYDNDASLAVVNALFDETVSITANSKQTKFTVKELPILANIGRYCVSIVARNQQGIITITDGVSGPVDRYLGIDN